MIERLISRKKAGGKGERERKRKREGEHRVLMASSLLLGSFHKILRLVIFVKDRFPAVGYEMHNRVEKKAVKERENTHTQKCETGVPDCNAPVKRKTSIPIPFPLVWVGVLSSLLDGTFSFHCFMAGSMFASAISICLHAVMKLFTHTNTSTPGITSKGKYHLAGTPDIRNAITDS